LLEGEIKMAAKPLPITGPANEVDIDQYGNVSGSVIVDNAGVVRFHVTQYPIDPNTGQPYNQCIVSIQQSDVSWATTTVRSITASPDAGTSTIKVGQ
jgi:hypothetical protein